MKSGKNKNIRSKLASLFYIIYAIFVVCGATLSLLTSIIYYDLTRFQLLTQHLFSSVILPFILILVGVVFLIASRILKRQNYKGNKRGMK